MSMDLYHVTGCGFDIETVTRKVYSRFIEKHRHSLGCEHFDELMKFLKKTGDAEFYEYRDYTRFTSLSEPVSEIINTETGIGVFAPGDSDGLGDCVVFSPLFPWEYSEKERSIKSMSELVSILEPYARELGTKVDTDLDLIYYG